MRRWKVGCQRTFVTERAIVAARRVDERRKDMMELREGQLTRKEAMDVLEGVSEEEQASGWELW